MNEQPLISIIIPVYNAGKYLNACIDSVLKQTYSNIEVVLVNDGSKDSSGDICNQYQSKDSRIKVIHLENGGVSRARNKGIELCNGDYICFIDSDDTIEPNYIKDFKDSIEEHIYIYIQGTNIIRQNGPTDKVSYKAIGINDIYGIFYTNKLCDHGYAACKMYSSSLIKKNNIKFREEIKFSEDLLFILECLLFTDKIKYIDKSGYNYFLREGNASSKEYPFDVEKKCWKYFYSLIKSISTKYDYNLLQYNSVGEIYNMLFSRIRNALYNSSYSKEFRTSFFKSLTKDELYYVYKYSYISNNVVRLGYYIRKFFGVSLMDMYFKITYKYKR